MDRRPGGRLAARDRWEFEALNLKHQDLHPLHFAGAEEFAAIALWREYRGGDFSRGPLPFAGGAAEQPAKLMDAFNFIAGLWAASEPKPEGKPDP